MQVRFLIAALVLSIASFAAPFDASAIPVVSESHCTVSSSEASLQYSPLGHQAAEGAIVVHVRCRGNGSIPIAVGASPGSSGSFAARTMRGDRSSDVLHYNIYYDGGVFGDGSDGTTLFRKVLDIGSGEVDDAFLLHVVAGPNQDVSVGKYRDSLVLNIDY